MTEENQAKPKTYARSQIEFAITKHLEVQPMQFQIKACDGSKSNWLNITPETAKKIIDLLEKEERTS